MAFNSSTKSKIDTSVNATKLAVAIAASAYFLYYSQTKMDWHFIDNVNLIFHEAGHTIFFFFGNFIHIIGGSLFQTLVPIVFVLYFLNQRQNFSAALLLFWVGQNIINVSVYAADAVVMQLPLLGGDTDGHDWHNIFSMLGVLKYTDVIAYVFYWIGFVVILAAIFFSILFSFESKK